MFLDKDPCLAAGVFFAWRRLGLLALKTTPLPYYKYSILGRGGFNIGGRGLTGMALPSAQRVC